mgnify:CR=1 FL=1
MSKGLKIVFSFSLILNFLFFGLVSGVIYKKHFSDFESVHFERRHKMMESKLNKLVEKLPKSHKKAFKGKVQQFFQSQQETKEEYLNRKQALITLLIADNFDRDTYRAKIKELNLLHQKQASQRTELISSIISKLSPEERKHVVKAFKHKKWFH